MIFLLTFVVCHSLKCLVTFCKWALLSSLLKTLLFFFLFAWPLHSGTTLVVQTCHLDISSCPVLFSFQLPSGSDISWITPKKEKGKQLLHNKPNQSEKHYSSKWAAFYWKVSKWPGGKLSDANALTHLSSRGAPWLPRASDVLCVMSACALCTSIVCLLHACLWM